MGALIKTTRKGVIIKDIRRRVDKAGGIHIGRAFAEKYYIMSCSADGVIVLKPEWENKEINNEDR
jgi:hypothetical protein